MAPSSQSVERLLATAEPFKSLSATERQSLTAADETALQEPVGIS